jgi:hypothetical protein
MVVETQETESVSRSSGVLTLQYMKLGTSAQCKEMQFLMLVFIGCCYRQVCWQVRSVILCFWM